MNRNPIILILLLIFLIPASYALPDNLEDQLFAYLDSDADALHVSHIKQLNKERNLDVANAYERYFVAKKNVSIARAAINPISTGTILGISMGATYLWAPLAIDVVLSLPTKFYNIQKNKALKNAEYWTFLYAKDQLANEVSKLYFDILTNEFILNTIDLEVSLYNELYESYGDGDQAEENRRTLEATILSLQKESLTFQDVVIKERAALNSILSYGPDTELILGQDNRFLKSVADDVTTTKYLSELAFDKSKNYKAKYWMYHASEKNVKLVKWSILSFSGLNMSYPQRVKVAKAEKEVALEEMKLSAISTRHGAVNGLAQLKNAHRLQQIREEKSRDSLNFSAGVRTNYEYGQLHLADYVKTAVTSIRNFRSFIVSHYQTLAKIEDFRLAMGTNIDYSTDGILDVNNL